ncbi:hypothetical protein [Rhodoferax sp. BLA1]|uniref:hypothetical protein n=1 Tax=Rhodoferax sp. BLA1 TaxID=2576062 RepID=UPI0015D2A114|nr:hypothetical protein [Rhodoferax sp. BLA1]
MTLIKTDKGREALRSRDPHLAPRERQIVILANGTHSRVSLQQLLARDIGPQLHRLLASGYLEERGPTPPSQPYLSAPAPATAAVGVERSSALPKTEDQSQPPRTRRSLAGTKMYIVDMLQLLRDMDASSMAVCVHSSQGEAEFIENVVLAVRLIVAKCGPSYGLRVVNTLLDTVPELHVAVFQTLAREIEAGGAQP